MRAEAFYYLSSEDKPMIFNKVVEIDIDNSANRVTLKLGGNEQALILDGLNLLITADAEDNG